MRASFQSPWSCRINLHQRHCSGGSTSELSIAICCIFTWPLAFWETVDVLLWSVIALWVLSPSLIPTHTPTSWGGSCFRQLLNDRLVKCLFSMLRYLKRSLQFNANKRTPKGLMAVLFIKLLSSWFLWVHHRNLSLESWKSGPAIKTSCCSCWASGFSSQL